MFFEALAKKNKLGYSDFIMTQIDRISNLKERAPVTIKPQKIKILFGFIILLTIALFFPRQRSYIKIDDTLLTYEIADTPAMREKGLMFRKNLPKDHSMLFIYPEVQPRCCFWMKNTYIPLDIAFLDQDYTVIQVFSRDPLSEKTSCASNTQYILETNKGWFSRHMINPGTRVQFVKKVKWGILP